MKWSHASASPGLMRKLVFSIPIFHIIVGRGALTEWSRLSAMMKLAIVDSIVKIESFRSMIILMSIRYRKEGKDGAWMLGKKL